MNEVLKAIANRFSCREFTPEMPTDEQLGAIALAAVQSPSGMNRQGWRAIVVKNRELISEFEQVAMDVLKNMEDQAMYQRIMSRGGTVFYHAPCMIMVPIAPGSQLDCGIVTENISLAATSLGLGSLICGMAGIPFSTPRGEEFKSRFGFPEGYEFGIAVLIGTPVAPGKAHEPDMEKISYIN